MIKYIHNIHLTKGNYHVHEFGTVVNKLNKNKQVETINSNKETVPKHIDICYILNSTILSNSLYILPFLQCFLNIKILFK